MQRRGRQCEGEGLETKVFTALSTERNLTKKKEKKVVRYGYNYIISNPIRIKKKVRTTESCRNDDVINSLLDFHFVFQRIPQQNDAR